MSEIDITDSGIAALGQPGVLREAELLAMVEASPDGMLLVDGDGHIVFVNPAIGAIFGYDQADLIGSSVDQLLPDRLREVHRGHRAAYRARPEVRAMGSGLDLRGRRYDGSEFPVEVSLSPVVTGNGAGVVATVRDVTDRVAVEALNHAVLGALDAAHDAVFMFTADSLEFRYVNLGGVRQLGFGREELLGMSPLLIEPEFTEAEFRAMIGDVVDGSTDTLVFTTIHRRKDGGEVPVEVNLECSAFLTPGEPRMLVAIVRDISDRLEAEAAQRGREVATQLLADRERLARDLHDLVIQRVFAAGIGLQALHTLVTDATVRDRMTQTVEELDQAIAELRSAIFQLTRAAGSTVRDKINAIVDDAARRLGFDPTITIEGDPASIPAPITDELLPVLTETLSNVVRHARATRADVKIRISDEKVTVTVTDNGIGIDPRRPRGNGIHNLEARAQRVDGGARVENNSEATGTTVIWTAMTAAFVEDAEKGSST